MRTDLSHLSCPIEPLASPECFRRPESAADALTGDKDWIGQWTAHCGRWTADDGHWTVDFGRGTVDTNSGQQIVNGGQWTIDSREKTVGTADSGY